MDEVSRARQTALAKLYREKIVQYFRYKGLDPAAAQDCTQETFIRINGVELSELERPDAYLLRIAANVFLERIRRARARREKQHVSIDSVELVDKVELVDRESSPARIYEGRERLLRLAAIVDELPQRTREVFLLNRLDGLTYTQLAARFGVSVGTIEKQISHALARLRARIDSDEPQA
jgi:RNA polymerase sigma-70 factor (ECF subfamily)